MALWLLTAVACSERCACGDGADLAELKSANPETLSGSIQWRVSAEGYEELTLVGRAGRLSSSPDDDTGSVLWVGKGSRGGWLHHVELALDVNRLTPGPSAVDLVSSRCRVRYLEDGRETEADFSVAESELRSLSYGGGQWTASVTLTCEKLVETRADGEPYAQGLPRAFQISTTAWAR